MWRRLVRAALTAVHQGRTPAVQARYLTSSRAAASATSSALATVTLRAVEPGPRPGEIALVWSDGRRSRFHDLWLRDNCRCPKCIDASSLQKLKTVSDLPCGVHGDSNAFHVHNGGLHVRWRIDGHESVYPAEFLRQYDYSHGTEPRRLPDQVLWGAELNAHLPQIQYSDLEQNETQTLRTWLTYLYTHGLCLVRGVPTEPGMVGRVAQRISYIRRTIYGDVWDVVSTPNAANVAYTSLGIPLHQDLLYYEAPPGLQFLHCLRFDAHVRGGDSAFVDGLRVAAAVRQRDPDAFERLCTTPISFHYLTAGHRLRHRRTPIVRRDGRVVGVNISPPWEAPMMIAPDQVVPMYGALRILHEEMKQPEHTVRFRLNPGDLVSFDNRRTLHARDAYEEGTAGERHLQGTYVDADEAMSRLEALLEQAPRTDM